MTRIFIFEFDAVLGREGSVAVGVEGVGKDAVVPGADDELAARGAHAHGASIDGAIGTGGSAIDARRAERGEVTSCEVSFAVGRGEGASPSS